MVKKKEYLIKKKRNLIFFSDYFKYVHFEGFINKSFSENSHAKLVQHQIKYFLNCLYVPIISAQCISNFISAQLTESLKNKELAFKKNLKQGILKMIQVCFNTKTIRYISGIKILCSGR
jgi:hypothetical protein